MVYLRWQLKHTSGWIEAPGVSRTCLFLFGPPPRPKGIMRLFILETSVCSHKPLWALAQLTKLCELLQCQTSRFRGCRWYGLPDRKVLALLKDYVSVIRFSNIMQCEESNGGDRVLWEKCANLCRVYKLIMVSRVPGYGHLDYLVFELLLLISSLFNLIELSLMMILLIGI